MNQAWYQVISLLYGYIAVAAIAVIAVFSLRKLLGDAALLRRVRKNTPQVGAAGRLRVLSGATRRLPLGQEIRVPYEGTLGSAHSCDVCIPYRKVHMRSAFFWMEQDGLHMVALHRDGFHADGVRIDPGDEAILSDGAVLSVRELKLELKLYPAAYARSGDLNIGPYVTTARRSRAQQGRGEGIGAPGKGEMRREKKLRKKMDDGKTGTKKSAARKKTTEKTR